MEKAVVVALLAGLVFLSAGEVTQKTEITPTPQIENASENITQTESKEVPQDAKIMEGEEGTVLQNSELTSTPMHQEGNPSSPSSSSSSSEGESSSSSGSSSSSTAESSGGGFDIGGSDDVIDYGTVCGTCGGPWDEGANRCWHCNPK